MRTLIILCLSILVFGFSTQAQTISELKKKQQQAKKKIELTNKLLKETQNNQKSTVSNLSVLKKQIDERENLISALNTEITVLDKNLSMLNSEKQILLKRLEQLRKEYANLVYHAYFFKNEYNQYLFVFSSETFTQAFRRLRYVQQYSNYRKEQSLQIMEVTNQLQKKENQLTETKVEKSTVLQGKEVENSQLQTARMSKQKMLADLTKKEKELREQLKKDQKQIQELNDKIDQLIAREIEAAERKANARRQREEAKKLEKAQRDSARKAEKEAKAAKKAGKPAPVSAPIATEKPATPITKPGQANLTEEEGVIAGGFEKNRGRLPWPARGVITGHFGIQNHPVLQHVQINNKGIYILSVAGADAACVYEGEVTQVFSIPGSNNAIIVKHGNFRTVYANLTNTYVKVGSKVSARQKLGRIFVDEESNGKTELYFMLYNNSTLENPERWLGK